MNPEDKEKTALATHKDLFQFKKMPFGLTNAPGSFMCLMEIALQVYVVSSWNSAWSI